MFAPENKNKKASYAQSKREDYRFKDCQVLLINCFHIYVPTAFHLHAAVFPCQSWAIKGHRNIWTCIKAECCSFDLCTTCRSGNQKNVWTSTSKLPVRVFDSTRLSLFISVHNFRNNLKTWLLMITCCFNDCRRENQTISALNSLIINYCAMIISSEVVTYSGNPTHFASDPFENEPGLFPSLRTCRTRIGRHLKNERLLLLTAAPTCSSSVGPPSCGWSLQRDVMRASAWCPGTQPSRCPGPGPSWANAAGRQVCPLWQLLGRDGQKR